MEGRSVDALQAARQLVSMLSLADVQKDPVLEQNMPTPYLALVRFGRWGEMLREAPPPKTLRFTMGMWHYARGLTLSATQRFSGAEAELAEVALVERSLPKGNRTDLKTARALLKIAERVLAGELAARRGRSGEAIQSLKDAVVLEDRLPYAEPPYWDHPVRQRLGAVLLAADRAAEAETVYREDLKRHPENGWSLYGLLQSLRAQEKTDEAAAVESRFEQAWSRADVSLTGSSF
jgi:tetratricopeptide (TPR) repeat protein